MAELKILEPIVFKKDRLAYTIKKRPKLIKENRGCPTLICVLGVNGTVYALSRGMHSDEVEHFNLKPEEVKTTGWFMPSGKFLWR